MLIDMLDPYAVTTQLLFVWKEWHDESGPGW
jgi:hypothetical protein